MTTVFTTYTADYTGRREHAQREDGQWFTRGQYRDPRYGYKWTKWEATNVPPRAGKGIERKIRLPE